MRPEIPAVTTRRPMRLGSAVAVLLACLALGCSSDDGGEVRNLGSEDGASASGSASASATAPECTPVGDASTATETVDVTLDEWTVDPAERSVTAGSVHFAADNIGGEAHELVLVLDVPELPIVDGRVDEGALPEGALIGEIEAFPAGETCDGTFELVAGSYTLFCNLTSTDADGTVQSHIDNGMVTTIVVE